MAGKGDRDRVVDFKQYESNYVLIDWSSSGESCKTSGAENIAGREDKVIHPVEG